MRPSAAGFGYLLVSWILSETFVPVSNVFAQTPVPDAGITPAITSPAIEIAQADSIVSPEIPPPAVKEPPPPPPSTTPPAIAPPPAQQPPAATPPAPAAGTAPTTLQERPPPGAPAPGTIPPPTTAPATTPPPAPPPAAKPMAVVPDFLVAFGINYIWVSGSELEKVDPSFGFRATGAMHLFSQVSACASLAYNSSSVDGQVTQLMDRYVRPDRRSGNVVGDVKFFRLGLGARVDAMSTEDWKYRPYAQGELLYAQTELNLDSVDGEPPAPGIVPFSQWKLGALFRAGMDYGLNENFGLEFFGAYEIIEFPAGSMALAGFQLGGTYRF